ncbi:DUF5304 domain-containing protein [Streptomyces sp. NPDC060194]|uniref:DUF5304 domain-containing protein n=1 Tax=Streptomyces sp. NPDC060194 TaxID=3347069 RepID=UPI003667E502
MSEAADRTEQPDADAWEQACAEDLAAEQARRRAQYGTPPGSAADELRKLADAVADRLSSLPLPLPGLTGTAAQGLVRDFVTQARAAVEPVIERNPDVFDQLAAAGGELLAAYRSAVSGHESRWTATDPGAGTRFPTDPAAPRKPDDGDDPSKSERIDLD